MSIRKPDTFATCPRCLMSMGAKYPATSRRDNDTQICTYCGVQEALVDLARSRGAHIPELQVEREARMKALIAGCQICNNGVPYGYSKCPSCGRAWATAKGGSR